MRVKLVPENLPLWAQRRLSASQLLTVTILLPTILSALSAITSLDLMGKPLSMNFLIKEEASHQIRDDFSLLLDDLAGTSEGEALSWLTEDAQGSKSMLAPPKLATAESSTVSMNHTGPKTIIRDQRSPNRIHEPNRVKLESGTLIDAPPSGNDRFGQASNTSAMSTDSTRDSARPDADAHAHADQMSNAAPTINTDLQEFLHIDIMTLFGDTSSGAKGREAFMSENQLQSNSVDPLTELDRLLSSNGDQSLAAGFTYNDATESEQPLSTDSLNFEWPHKRRAMDNIPDPALTSWLMAATQGQPTQSANTELSWESQTMQQPAKRPRSARPSAASYARSPVIMYSEKPWLSLGNDDPQIQMELPNGASKTTNNFWSNNQTGPPRDEYSCGFCRQQQGAPIQDGWVPNYCECGKFQNREFQIHSSSWHQEMYEPRNGSTKVRKRRASPRQPVEEGTFTWIDQKVGKPVHTITGAKIQYKFTPWQPKQPRQKFASASRR